ncbi:tetratricopeptide repeat protein [Planctomycetota bacterium]
MGFYEKMAVVILMLAMIPMLAGCQVKITEDDPDQNVRKSLWEEAQDKIDPDAPPDSAPDHFERALYFLANDRLDQAHIQFSLAIEKDPEHAGAHNGLGYSYTNLYGDLVMANYHWEQALKFNPDRDVSLGAHLGLGVVYCKRGLRRQHEEENPELLMERYNPDQVKLLRSSEEYFNLSQSHLKQVLKYDPKSREVFYEYGTLSMARGEYEMAMQYYRKYLGLHGPGDNLAIRRAYEGMAVAQEGQGKLFEAIASLKQALKVIPEARSSEMADRDRLRITLEIDRLERRILEGDRSGN